jgi:hypothetical protein
MAENRQSCNSSPWGVKIESEGKKNKFAAETNFQIPPKKLFLHRTCPSKFKMLKLFFLHFTLFCEMLQFSLTVSSVAFGHYLPNRPYPIVRIARRLRRHLVENHLAD